MLSITFTILMIVFSLAATWLMYSGLFRDRSRGCKRCPKCWYDMRGSPTLLCPECGHEAKTEQMLLHTRRAWRRVGVGLLCAIMAWHAWQVRGRLVQRQEPLRWAAVPSVVFAVGATWGDVEWEDAAIDRFRPGRDGEPREWGWQRDVLARAFASAIEADVPSPRTMRRGEVLVWLSRGSALAVRRCVKLIETLPRNNALRLYLPRQVLDQQDVYLFPDLSRLVDDGHEGVEAASWEAIRRMSRSHLARPSVTELTAVIDKRTMQLQRLNRRVPDFRSVAPVEPLAAELGRRGPEGLAALYDRAAQLTPWISGTPIAPLCLAALRQANGESMPWAVQLLDEPLIARKDGAIIMRAQIINQEREFPNLVCGVQDPRHERPTSFYMGMEACSVPAGSAAQPAKRKIYGITVRKSATIKPDEPLEVEVDLNAYLDLARPGTYDVTLLYDPLLAIWDGRSYLTTVRSKSVRTVVPAIPGS